MEKTMLKAAGILWVIWGVVHILAGVMTLSQDTAIAFAGILDAVDPALLENDYHAGVGAVLKQHGYNLLLAGAATTVGGVFVWRGDVRWIIISALVGGLVDVGYFVFIDLGGFNKFFPGTIMTIISASAIVLSFVALFRREQGVSMALQENRNR